MDLETFIWGYFPILIAIIGILISTKLFRLKPTIKNGLLTLLIVIINGFAIYILFQIINDSWPTFTPHLGLILSTILVLIQWQVNRKNKK